MDATGYMLATGDQHAGELIGFAWEMVGLEGHDFELLARRRGEFSRQLDEASEGETELTPWLNGRSKERVVDVIVALHTGQKSHELSANITNRGYISNLPDDAIVEVPVVVDGAGIHGIQVGELPTMIAAMCLQQIAIQELAVEAAATGNRQVALQALLIDPVVNSQVMAKSVLDELLTVHAENLPNFYA
jgi:alpha-galactosidase